MTTILTFLFSILSFGMFVLVLAGTLWLGVKLFRLPGSFASLLGISLFAGLLGLIPWVGWLAALGALVLLTCKISDADLWPHVIPMLLFAVFTTGASQFGLYRIGLLLW